MESIKPLTLSKNLEILKSLAGKTIIQVKRQILKSDMDLDNFEQRADGPTELRFSDNQVIHFNALPEINSISIINAPMSKCGDSYTLLDVTDNEFWRRRVNHQIKIINILKSKYASEDNPSEFGLEFQWERNLKAYIEYLNEEEFLDTIRVVEDYTGPPCIKIRVF